MIDQAVVGYLRRFGYLEAGEQGKARAGLMRFQRAFGLAETGQVDEPNRSLLHQPRCGVPDPLPGAAAMGAGDAWQKQRLTWSIVRPTEKVPSPVNAVAMAFRIWATYTPLVFDRVAADEPADIIVRFDSGAHGDGFPHDGPGNVLAHAFFPPPLSVGEELAGDMHFDDDENWTVRLPLAPNETDLVTVALHEIGHALGLGHSMEFDDIMFPFISGVQRHLSDNDITRIRGLYGDGHDGLGTPTDAMSTAALWYSGVDELHAFTLTPVMGRRVRRHVSGRWEEWRELGGEYDPVFTVDPAAVPDGSGAVLFGRSYQKHIHAQSVGDVDGSLQSLGGRHSSSFYTAGMAGQPTVFVTARPSGPDEMPGPRETRSNLFERSFDGATLTRWHQVAQDVEVLPAVASHSDGTATLVACVSGRIRSFDGIAGEWGPMVELPEHPALDLRTPFWPISATATDNDTVDVAIVLADRSLIHSRRVGNTWSPWQPLGDSWNTAQLLADGVGNLALVAKRHREYVYLTRFVTGSWQPWERIGDRATILGAAAQPGRIDLILSRSNHGGFTHHTLPI